MTHFLHYAPTGHFEDGIFAPYNSLGEAERQATWDLMNDADPDIFQGIFEAEHEPPPKLGWRPSQVALIASGEPSSPHLDPANRTPVHDLLSLVTRAKELAPIIEEENKRAEEEWLLEIHETVRRGEHLKNAVPGNAYTWCTGGTATATPKALAAATAATVVLTLAASSNQQAVTEIGVSFDGVTAANVPVLVELVSGTAGGAGTPRTTLAAGHQIRSWPAQTSGTTAGDNYTAEPTTQLVLKKWFVTPNGGLFVVPSPLGREPTGIITAATDAKTLSLRCTAPAIVNCHAYIEWEE